MLIQGTSHRKAQQLVRGGVMVMSAAISRFQFRVNMGIFSLLDLAVAAEHPAAVVNDDSADIYTY